MTAWILRISDHDAALLHALVRRRRAWLDAPVRALTRLGDAVTTISAAVLLLAVDRTGIGARSAFALLVSHLGVQAVKRTVNRPRPRLPVGIDSLVHAPDRFSFPSGHAAASLSVALPLALALPLPLGGALLAVALAVGGSRAYLGVHYPGDVLAGWVLATAAVAVGPTALHMVAGLG